MQKDYLPCKVERTTPIKWIRQPSYLYVLSLFAYPYAGYTIINDYDDQWTNNQTS